MNTPDPMTMSTTDAVPVPATKPVAKPGFFQRFGSTADAGVNSIASAATSVGTSTMSVIDSARAMSLNRDCDNCADFAYVEIPYACKLLFQELNTMNIAPRLMTDK